MDVTLLTEAVANYGAMGVMLYWFMTKHNTDMQLMRQESELNRSAIINLTKAIEKIGVNASE